MRLPKFFHIGCETCSILRTFHNLSYKSLEVVDHSPTKASSSSWSGAPKRAARFQEIHSHSNLVFAIEAEHLHALLEIQQALNTYIVETL